MPRKQPEQRQTQTGGRRSVRFVVLGVVLLTVAGVLLYDVYRRTVDTVNPPSVYQYTVNQQISTAVTYSDSDYFTGGTPGFGNTAYVADLTRDIKAAFHYEYRASRQVDLTTTFLATATVRGKYVLGVDGKTQDTVWSKDYRIVPAETETVNAKTVTFDREVTVPYSEYKKTLEQLRSSLQLPITSEMQVLFSVHVTGMVDGSPINDTRTSTISAPLDQPLFTLTNKFDKTDKKQVAGKAAIDTQAAIRNYERIAAVAVGLLGIAAIAFGLRKQIFKTSYQRELDKIYRLHDGIIIRARSRADLSKKNVVPVQSFDDMLNLEDELKTPIVAAPAGRQATKFLIMHSDVAYVYTLGQETDEELDGPLADIDSSFLKSKHSTRK